MIMNVALILINCDNQGATAQFRIRLPNYPIRHRLNAVADEADEKARCMRLCQQPRQLATHSRFLGLTFCLTM